ncbi:beta-galactosidase [Kovacikia minuta CCNUW1]|uniref:beta-galactosidase n=1 Tax=Kovacikia minuta TaxID=2931930 RepID=UPI001CCC1372|nr:beta-galactosidase [Kovacikia minuta]UBF27517.1 beta-galactosidase [Kovacikia minuta CCNUW1]
MATPSSYQVNSDPAHPITWIMRPAYLGTTFSQLQCRYIGLDYRDTFNQVCSLGFDRIRLCSYWNEIESIENQFDFSALDWLLEESDRRGIEVVLTVGMKAPRWPEFHFPDWLSARYDTSGNPKPVDRNPAIADLTLHFIDRVMTHTRNAPNLKYWQIENEPFTHLDITAGRFLSYEFVRREVELARSLALPGQKILLTNALTLPAAQFIEDEHAFRESVALADAVGINVYSKVPAGNTPFYVQPLGPYWKKLRTWQQTLSKNGKEGWIAESQAEPWEPNELVAMKKNEYPSSSPKQAETLVTSLTDIGYGTVMLWGCEYWYWQKQNGRDSWWSMMQQLVERENG